MLKLKKSAPDEELESFDPWLGGVVAETWWRLGARLASVNNAKTPKERMASVDAWVNDMREEVREARYVSPKVVTRECLQKFIDDVLGVLEAKYNSKPVAKQVTSLTHLAGKGDVIEDDGPYLRFIESEESFWAVEYEAIFEDLQKRRKESTPDWRVAVGYCEDPKCRKFFVRGRSDNRYHSDECRMRTANRAAYQAKKEKLGHGTRSRRPK